MGILGWAGAALAVAVVIAGSVASCSGHGGGCHNDSDCFGQVCEGPNGPPSCGIPPKMGCAASANCAAPEVCHSIFDACSASGLGSECGPPCSGDAACGTGLRCNAQGACEPIPCDQGFTCQPYQRCNPVAATGPVWQHDHGCETVTCHGDSDCPASTACVNGGCQSGPGQCVTPRAVP